MDLRWKAGTFPHECISHSAKNPRHLATPFWGFHTDLVRLYLLAMQSISLCFLFVVDRQNNRIRNLAGPYLRLKFCQNKHKVVLHFAKSREVTSPLKWVYSGFPLFSKINISKINISKFQFDPGMHEHFWTSSCELLGAPWIIDIHILINILKLYFLL